MAPVANMVEKQHKDLMRDIRGYIDQMEELGQRNFAPSDFFTDGTYTSEQNKQLPCYLISKKGCEFIANKLTGSKGTLFTALYVTKFNAMEQQEQKKSLSAMDMIRLQLAAMTELDSRVDALEEKVEKQITLDHGQQRTLQNIVSKRAYERAGQAFPSDIKENAGRFFYAIYKDLKNRFDVASYRDINVNDYVNAIHYVQAWIEPAEIRTGAA